VLFAKGLSDHPDDLEAGLDSEILRDGGDFEAFDLVAKGLRSERVQPSSAVAGTAKDTTSTVVHITDRLRFMSEPPSRFGGGSVSKTVRRVKGNLAAACPADRFPVACPSTLVWVLARHIREGLVSGGMVSQRIGFIGAGQMAQALARGWVRSGHCAGEQIWAFDPYPASAAAFGAAVPGATLTADNRAVVAKADVIWLAVKPQQMGAALQSIRGDASAAKLFVSIAAGVTLAGLTEGLGSGRVIRVMPNTPCLVGQGASAFAAGPSATDEDCQLVEQLLTAVGFATRVEEKLLDAVTGLSGSGPAFVYVMIEALSDAGVKVGLPRATAQALAAQTVRGAAEMVLATGEHPAVLKDKVASPGGTTIAGLAALEHHGLRGALIAAVEAATLRSHELGAAK